MADLHQVREPWSQRVPCAVVNNMDAALLKNFKVRESMRLQVRGEALNILNHPNFDGIVTDLNSSSFGRSQILVGNAVSRILQLGARFTF